MSITDELREYAEDWDWLDTGAERAQDRIEAIADRIDAEHEAMLVDARKTVYQGYIELPKDADDVPWNVGDRDEDGNEVIAFKLASDGWYVITDGEWPYRPERKRHYHAPTVEDVLREFAERYLDYEGIPSAGRRGVGEALMDEYASKLRLAEEEDA